MIDHIYTCTTAACPRERQPTRARWCVACSTPTQPETPAVPEPAAAAPRLRPGAPAPGGPRLSPEWRRSARTAAVAVGAMLAFSVAWLVLLAVLASGDGGDPGAEGNVGSLLRFIVTLVPLSMHGALVVEGGVRTASAGGDQGQLSLVLPPLLGAVVGLAVLAAATSRRVRPAPPGTLGELAVDALRTGAAFAALLGAMTLLTYGTVQDGDTARMSWHVAPIGVAWWSLLLGTLAAGLGAIAAVVRTGHSRELLAAVSPAQRGWLRALGGGAVAAGTALGLGTVAVAVLVGVGLSKYAAATGVSSLIQISPWMLAGLAAVFLPAAAIQVLGLGLGATVVAGSSGDATHAGYLAGSGLPGWAYLLLGVPALAVLAGGLWMAAREQADPEPQPAGWLRFGAATTALFGLLLVLGRFKVHGSAGGGIGSVLSLLPTGGQDRVSAVVGFRLADGLLLAFGWAALGGLAAERLFPVLLRRYGQRVARVRVGRLGLLPAPPATPRRPAPAAPRRPTRAVGMVAAVVAVVAVAVWLGAGHGGTPDGSAVAEAAPTGATAVPEPTLDAPPETTAAPGLSPLDSGASPDAGTDPDAGTGEPQGPPSELAAAATASASSTAPDSVDAAGNPISYSAGNLTDGDPQTAWRVAGDGRGETITLTLASAAHLTRVGLIPGYAKVDPSSGADRFPENRRVREVRWRFDDGTTVDQRFADSRDLQETEVDTTTRSVTIEILSTRPGTPDHDYLAISEVSLVGG
jgi:hypothetical protein